MKHITVILIIAAILAVSLYTTWYSNPAGYGPIYVDGHVVPINIH